MHFCAVSASVLIAWRAGFISAVERMDGGDVIALTVMREKRMESVYS